MADWALSDGFVAPFDPLVNDIARLLFLYPGYDSIFHFWLSDDLIVVFCNNCLNFFYSALDSIRCRQLFLTLHELLEYFLGSGRPIIGHIVARIVKQSANLPQSKPFLVTSDIKHNGQYGTTQLEVSLYRDFAT